MNNYSLNSKTSHQISLKPGTEDKLSKYSPIEASNQINSVHKFSKESVSSSKYRQKIFNQTQLSKNEQSENMLNTVKSSLDITSKGLLSVFILGDKIIENSKKALSTKKDLSLQNMNFQDEDREAMLHDRDTDQSVDLENPLPGNCCPNYSENKINCFKNSEGSFNKQNFESIRSCSQNYPHGTKFKNSEDNRSHDHCKSHNHSNGSLLEDIEEEKICTTGNIGHCHSHDMNFTGMLIHLLGDVISSLCVVISSIIVVNYNWVYFDTICSIVICVAIILSTLPLNYAIFKKMKNAFAVTKAEETYIRKKIEEVE